MPPYVTTLKAVSAELVGRPPSDAERTAHDLPALARALAASEEHAALLARGGGMPEAVLTGTPAALAAHPVGTVSPDGPALVGDDGWLQMLGDTNDVAAQATGTYVLPSGWAAAWEALIARHHAVARRIGARVAHLMVPDRVPLLRSSFPGLASRWARARSSC